MRIFAPMYEAVTRWAQHPKAPWFLGGMSFAESSFFPIPVDAMLAPMAMKRPKQWWWLALLAAVTSVLGGLFGYLMGMLFWHLIEPFFIDWGLMPVYEQVAEKITQEGIWVLFLASFTPIPYKVATIASGTLGMPVLPFILVSFVGRSLRFGLVAGLMALFGAKIEHKLHQYIEWAGWISIALCVAAYAVYKFI